MKIINAITSYRTDRTLTLGLIRTRDGWRFNLHLSYKEMKHIFYMLAEKFPDMLLEIKMHVERGLDDNYYVLKVMSGKEDEAQLLLAFNNLEVDFKKEIPESFNIHIERNYMEIDKIKEARNGQL